MMERRNWELDYEDLLRKSIALGEVSCQESGEKRESPRFKLNTGTIWVRLDQAFEVADISKDGISFFSPFKLIPGHEIPLTLGKAFLIDAIVVDCKMVITDEDFMESKYRICCRFKESETGIKMLVMMKEIEDAESGSTL